MAAIKNAIDTILQATTPRVVSASLPPNIIVGGGNLGVGTGKNLLPNAGFYLGLDKWVYTAGFALNLASWCLPSLQSTAWFGGVYAPGTGDATLYIDGISRVPVIAGQVIEASAYIASHRCTSYIYVDYYDASGNNIGTGTTLSANNVNAGDFSGGTSLAGYKRCSLFSVAPAGAVSAIFIFHKNPTNAGETSSYGFMVMPYLGIARPAQTELSPWSDGIGGLSSQIDSTNYKQYMAAQSVSAMAYAANTTGLTTNGTQSITLAFDSLGENVLLVASGTFESNAGGTTGVCTADATVDIVGGAVYLSYARVCKAPNTAESVAMTWARTVYIASPGAGSKTYRLQVDLTKTGTGSGGNINNAALQIIGLKR